MFCKCLGVGIYARGGCEESCVVGEGGGGGGSIKLGEFNGLEAGSEFASTSIISFSLSVKTNRSCTFCVTRFKNSLAMDHIFAARERCVCIETVESRLNSCNTAKSKKKSILRVLKKRGGGAIIPAALLSRRFGSTLLFVCLFVYLVS